MEQSLIRGGDITDKTRMGVYNGKELWRSGVESDYRGAAGY